MDARNYLTALRRSWWIPLLGAIAGVAIAILASKVVTPSYTAESQLFVSLEQGSTAGELANGATYTQLQMESYATLATSSIVLDPVIATLKLNTTSDALSKTINATVAQNTSVLSITASDPNAQKAADVANQVAASTIASITKFAPVTATGDRNVRVNTIQTAVPPAAPTSPKTTLNAILGLLAGLLIGLAFVLSRERLDKRVRDSGELAHAVGARVLGAVSHDATWEKAGPLAFDSLSASRSAEDLRKLRVDLQHAALDEGRTVLVVTSADAHDHRDDLVTGLSLAFAEAGVHTLLIDADLRTRAVSSAFSLDTRAGLSSLLVGDSTLEQSIRPWGTSTLDVLQAGPETDNASELLAGPPLAALLDRMRKAYEVVLIGVPDALDTAEAAIVGRAADGAIVVADAFEVHRPDVARAASQLRSAGVVVVGAVLNRARRHDADR
jgi:succinoglycan biosynthesis transport protein ExoP